MPEERSSAGKISAKIILNHKKDHVKSHFYKIAIIFAGKILIIDD